MNGDDVALTSEQKEFVLEWLYDGKALSRAARALGMKPKTLQKAVERDPLFAKEVADARSFGIDVVFEGLLTVADEYENPLRARVKMECIAKYAAALKPDKYGDRINLTVTRVDISSVLAEADKRLIDVLTPELKEQLDPAALKLIELNKADSTN